MYKKLKNIEKIDFDGLFNSKAPCFLFEYKKYKESKIRKFTEYVLGKYGYKMLGVNYDLDYRGFEEFFKDKNLNTFTGIEDNNKYVKLGYCVSNINENLSIYKTYTPYNYFHIFDKKLSFEEIWNICIDTINMESGIDIFFIFITDSLIMYPHSDRGFGFIDIDGNNINIIQDIIKYLNQGNDVLYDGNVYAKKYYKDNKINIKFEEY